MRYDAEHRGRTREKILNEAAAAIRATGPNAVGVATLMKRAGLTHGGFYAYFGSKGELVSAAIARMFEQAAARFNRALAAVDPRAGLSDYLNFYLSADHRDARDSGCPVAALATDIGRLEPQSRERFGEGIATLSRWLGAALTAHGVADGSEAGASMLAEMAGALTLARAVADPVQSDLILAQSRAAIAERYRLEERA